MADISPGRHLDDVRVEARPLRSRDSSRRAATVALIAVVGATAPLWVGLAIVLLVVVLFVALVGLDALYIEHVAEDFAPGRWESRGGQYYVDLGAEGEPSSFRLPLDPDDSGNCNPEPFESEATYAIRGNDWKSSAAFVDLAFLAPDGSEAGTGSFLTAGGFLSRGTDWRDLYYSTCDYDLVNVILKRVDSD